MSRNYGVGTGRAGCPSPPSCGFQSICIGRAGSPFDDGMVFPPHLPISRSGAVGHHALPQSGRCSGFTLVELMAVVVVICVLVAAVVGTAKYANRQMSVARAKAQMAALQMALKAYKADVGYYPASTIVRFSGSGNAELSNSWLLCRALTQPKTYYKASQLDIGIGSIVNVTTNQVSVPVLTVTYFKDPWGRPWNYYRPNSPQPASLVVSNIVGAWPVGPFQASYAIGGQMNPLTFDLFSFGPDCCTYIPNSTSGAYCWRWYGDQTQPQHAIDDINNWGR